MDLQTHEHPLMFLGREHLCLSLMPIMNTLARAAMESLIVVPDYPITTYATC